MRRRATICYWSLCSDLHL